MTGDAQAPTMDVIVEGKKITLPEPDARALIEAGKAAPAPVVIQVHDVRTNSVARYGEE